MIKVRPNQLWVSASGVSSMALHFWIFLGGDTSEMEETTPLESGQPLVSLAALSRLTRSLPRSMVPNPMKGSREPAMREHKSCSISESTNDNSQIYMNTSISQSCVTIVNMRRYDSYILLYNLYWLS